MTREFYDQLAPYYHLLYPDWERSIQRQGRGLAAVLSEFGAPHGAPILDAACGVGTQTIGLATHGYRVWASDLSPEAVARARREAASRHLQIDFAVADLRRLSTAWASLTGTFAGVVACDNAIPHLLSDGEIHEAFVESRRMLAPGGILLVSVRDYAAIERTTPDVRSYGVRLDGDHRYQIDQIWVWDGDQYDVTLRFVDDAADGTRHLHEFHSRYYAVELPTLERLLIEAGFERVERRDAFFFQPLLVAINPRS
jgi:SAM-dependent methyltransferase